jgi:arabinofuranosyltransferase
MSLTDLFGGHRRHGDAAFKIGAVIVLAVLYLLFIDRFSADLNGQRYFVLSDDQMISMRYADNLASGNGLVWNPGERVEGFTNPLWTGYMAVWHLVDIPRAKISLAIMLTSAMILILNALAVYSIASRLSPESPTVARVAMVLAGTYWPLVKWSLEGFEVGLTALLTSIVALETFRYMEARRTRHLVAMAVCLIALGWTRLEMLAVAGVPVAYLLLTDTARGRLIKIVMVPVMASVAALFTIRYWYYGEWLPNTYYLKLTGVALLDRLHLGLAKTWSTLETHFSIVFAPIVLTRLLTRPRFRGEHRSWILVAIFAVALLYTIYIGGDTWERPFHANRFLAATTPLLIAVALHLTSAQMRRVRWQGPAVALVVVSVGLLMAVGLGGRSFYRWLRSDVKHSTLFDMVALGEELRERAPLDTKVAVVWAGALPYFSRLHAIDLLGKSDKVIAHSTPHNMSPGHNKWNYEHSIGVLKPDIIIEMWHPRKEDLEYLTKLGYSGKPNGMYFRESP